jgi:hypothetical protein
MFFKDAFACVQIEPGTFEFCGVECVVPPKGVITRICEGVVYLGEITWCLTSFFFCEVSKIAHKLEQITDGSCDPLGTDPRMEYAIGIF